MVAETAKNEMGHYHTDDVPSMIIDGIGKKMSGPFPRRTLATGQHCQQGHRKQQHAAPESFQTRMTALLGLDRRYC